jgi:hypothetical protein
MTLVALGMPLQSLFLGLGISDQNQIFVLNWQDPNLSIFT